MERQNIAGLTRGAVTLLRFYSISQKAICGIHTWFLQKQTVDAVDVIHQLAARLISRPVTLSVRLSVLVNKIL